MALTGGLRRPTLGRNLFLAVAAFLMFAGFALSLSGLAAVGSSCHNAKSDAVNAGKRAGGAAGAAAALEKTLLGQALLIQDLGIPFRNNCAQVFAFQWFHIALQGVVFLVLLAAMIGRMRSWRSALALIILAEAVFMSYDTSLFIGFWRNVKELTGTSTLYKRVITAWCGFLIAAIADFIAVIFLADTSINDLYAYDGSHRRAIAPAGTTGKTNEPAMNVV